MGGGGKEIKKHSPQPGAQNQPWGVLFVKTEEKEKRIWGGKRTGNKGNILRETKKKEKENIATNRIFALKRKTTVQLRTGRKKLKGKKGGLEDK